MPSNTRVKGLMERLRNHEKVIVAEGYLFEAERRGLLQAGPFVPEFIVEKPQALKEMYEEFVECGSDVVLAFTYYAHRGKLRVVGKESIFEDLNRTSLRIAREVADASGTLMAGNICNSTIYDPTPESEKEVYENFRDQILLAVDEGADFIVAETYKDFLEAKLALKACKDFGNGLPIVVTLNPGDSGNTADGTELGEACRQLEVLGADVVGLNCGLGPVPVLKHMKRIQEVCTIPLACLPVPYRCSKEEPTMFQLRDPDTGKRSFPDQLDLWLCCRRQVREFTEEMVKMGIDYIGLCCGNRPIFIREMAETLGRKPVASKYTMDMSKHFSVIKHEYSLKQAKAIGLID